VLNGAALGNVLKIQHVHDQWLSPAKMKFQVYVAMAMTIPCTMQR